MQKKINKCKMNAKKMKKNFKKNAKYMQKKK